jgi:hypothetical protein
MSEPKKNCCSYNPKKPCASNPASDPKKPETSICEVRFAEPLIHPPVRLYRQYYPWTTPLKQACRDSKDEAPCVSKEGCEQRGTGGSCGNRICSYKGPDGECKDPKACKFRNIKTSVCASPVSCDHKGAKTCKDTTACIYRSSKGKCTDKGNIRLDALSPNGKCPRKVCSWNAGCYATCVAMILRWWAQDNDKTRTQNTDETQTGVQFKYNVGDKERETCPFNLLQRLYPPEKRFVSIKGTPKEWHFKFDQKIKEGVSIKIGGKKSNVVKTGRLRLLDYGIDQRKKLLKEALTVCGPIIANVHYRTEGKQGRSHEVVIQGYRNGILYVVDPGKVFYRFWGGNKRKSEGMRSGVYMPLSIDIDRKGNDEIDCYLAIKDSHKFRIPGQKAKSTFLSEIEYIHACYFECKDAQSNCHCKCDSLLIEVSGKKEGQFKKCCCAGGCACTCDPTNNKQSEKCKDWKNLQ